MRSSLLKVRRNPKHSCIAHIEESETEVWLNRVTADQGELPDMSSVVRKSYTNRKAVRAAILALMASVTN